MNPSALTEMVDRFYGDRYRIEELVGVGTISAVFRAFDLVEERWVALKVFDDTIGSDPDYVDRILAAAEHASTLTHANIAQITDWGNQDGPYIVSELCEGGSLAALLDEGHRLTPSQALVMTLECARALHFGHERGEAHRDLRPSNLLFTEDQRLRISDFGLAKVLADAPVAQRDAALDNVRYVSPEQARGRPVGPPTDLYSLAMIVNEAVTGEPPAVADTVVGTLMARAEASVTVSDELETLQAPLERCGRIDVDHRPEAEELTIALLAAAETMPRPASLPLVGLAGYLLADDIDSLGPLDDLDDFATDDSGAEDSATDDSGAEDFATDDSGAEDFATDDSGAEDFATDDSEAEDFVADDSGAEDFVAEVTAAQDAALDEPALRVVDEPSAPGGLENLAEAEAVFAPVPPVEDTPELDVPERVGAARSAKGLYVEQDDDADERLPWWPLLVLTLLIAGAVAAGVYFSASFGDSSTAGVPNLIGRSADDLATDIAGRGWQIQRLEDRVDGSEPGTIISQSPEPGAALDEGETLTVTVSLGNEMVEIPPDVVGLTVEQAASRLGSVGLLVGELSESNSEVFAAGIVVEIDEPTTQKPAGEPVALRISLGAEARTLPTSVIGMSIADATGLLTGLRLQAVEEPLFDPEIPEGTVMDSLPAPGSSVPADSQVILFVSAGPAPVVMPDLIGLSLEEAVEVVEELGLAFIDSQGNPGEDAIGSLPPAGATVDVGTEVIIILDTPAEEE